MRKEAEQVTKRRYCSVCGGDGWTDSMWDYRKENRLPASFDCVFCNGKGYVNEVKKGTQLK